MEILTLCSYYFLQLTCWAFLSSYCYSLLLLIFLFPQSLLLFGFVFLLIRSVPFLLVIFLHFLSSVIIEDLSFSLKASANTKSVTILNLPQMYPTLVCCFSVHKFKKRKTIAPICVTITVWPLRVTVWNVFMFFLVEVYCKTYDHDRAACARSWVDWFWVLLKLHIVALNLQHLDIRSSVEKNALWKWGVDDSSSANEDVLEATDDANLFLCHS